jgi:hypothetical protein
MMVNRGHTQLLTLDIAASRCVRPSLANMNESLDEFFFCTHCAFLTFAHRALCAAAIFARDFAESFRRLGLGVLPL